MKLLALDTSTEYLSLALRLAPSEVLMYHAHTGPNASQLILPQIRVLLKQANLTLHELDGIVFGAGPGAFTGVRVAVGVAQGLAFGAQLPVVGISTLLALAQASGYQQVITCLDARMGEVYHAVYQHQQGEWQSIVPASVCLPSAVPSVEGSAWVGVGSGWKMYATELSVRYALHSILPEVLPTAQAMLALALPMFERGETQTASEAMPLYVRNRVALTAQQRALGQVL